MKLEKAICIQSVVRQRLEYKMRLVGIDLKCLADQVRQGKTPLGLPDFEQMKEDLITLQVQVHEGVQLSRRERQLERDFLAALEGDEDAKQRFMDTVGSN